MMNKGSFEAKKHAYRQTQDGVVVSFVVHPNDVSAALATAPLGTRYMMGWAEISDDPAVEHAAALTVPVAESPVVEKLTPPRRAFDTLPLSQQAALRCNDKRFVQWLSCDNEEVAAGYVRDHCGVDSRSEILQNTRAGRLWAAMNQDFEAFLTTQQYADAIR